MRRKRPFHPVARSDFNEVDSEWETGHSERGIEEQERNADECVIEWNQRRRKPFATPIPVCASRVAPKVNIQFFAPAEQQVEQVSQVTPKNLASPGSARVLFNLKKPGSNGKEFEYIGTEKRTGQSRTLPGLLESSEVAAAWVFRSGAV